MQKSDVGGQRVSLSSLKSVDYRGQRSQIPGLDMRGGLGEEAAH